MGQREDLCDVTECMVSKRREMAWASGTTCGMVASGLGLGAEVRLEVAWASAKA
jgi:hypothetical protein